MGETMNIMILTNLSLQFLDVFEGKTRQKLSYLMTIFSQLT